MVEHKLTGRLRFKVVCVGTGISLLLSVVGLILLSSLMLRGKVQDTRVAIMITAIVLLSSVAGNYWSAVVGGNKYLAIATGCFYLCILLLAGMLLFEGGLVSLWPKLGAITGATALICAIPLKNRQSTVKRKKRYR